MSSALPMQRAAVRQRVSEHSPHLLQVVGLAARVLDIVAIIASAVIAHFMTTWPLMLKYEPLMLVTTLLVAMLSASAVRLYQIEASFGLSSVGLGRVALVWVGSLALALTIVFVVNPVQLPERQFVVVWAAVGVVLLAGSRLVVSAWVGNLRRLGKLGWNVVVVGSGRCGLDVRDRLGSDPLEARVIAYMEIGDVARGGDLTSALRQQLAARHVDVVTLALDGDDMHRIPELLTVLRDFPVEVGVVMPRLTATGVPTLGHRRIGDLTSVTCLKKPIGGWSWSMKSAFDRVAAFVLLLFLAPLLGVIALVVKVTSDGPVFFRQTRLGFNQQPINVYKFRSMYQDRCDAMLSNSVQHAGRNDPRVTPVGAILRRTSLDELPQLINVLQGSMSLVGPRPHAVAHDEYYANLIDGYLGRHRAKPGITGWAQVNGCRGEIFSLEDMRQRIELDLYYIDNWSLWFDLKILLRTVLVCFGDERAY